MIENNYDELLQANPFVDEMDRIVLDRLESSKRILEVGVGTGLLTEQIAKMQKSIVGIDPYEDAKSHKKIAEQRLCAYPDVDIIRANFFHYSGIPFDAIVARFTYHHIYEKEQFLSRCHNLLIPGGKVVIGDEFIPNRRNRDEAVREFHAYRATLVNQGILPDEGMFEADLAQDGEYKVPIEILQEQVLNAGFEKIEIESVGTDSSFDCELLGYKVASATK